MGIYHNASATFTYGQDKYTIIDILSGVLQGCPGSEILFNNALDPFLFLMHRQLREDNRGVIRACADDLGTAQARLKHLGLLFPIYESARHFAGLNLKPPKCNIVPLCTMSSETVKNIRKWLARNIPDWADFGIQDSTKMLGIYLGPGAGKYN